MAAAAAVFLAILVLAGVGRLDTSPPAFLEEALGPEAAEAPLVRTPATGVGVRIDDEGYTVSHWGVSVSVASEDVGGSDWRRHVHGATRETDFGTETIVVDGGKTEEFLTVTERQGTKTWRWKLASRLHPRLGPDGTVAFLDPTRHRVTTITIDPVRILDTSGTDVTPDGLRWGLEEGAGGWILTLQLDDEDLPLPYVIDPAVTHRASVATGNANGGAASLALNMPSGVQDNDLLVASLAVRGNVNITAPVGGGWTLMQNQPSGTTVRLATYYKVAGDTEPASYTWTFSGSQRAVGGISAFYGVRTATTPLDQIGAATSGTGTTATASSITTTAANDIALAFYASGIGTSFTAFAGPPAWTELYELQHATGNAGNRSTIMSAAKGMAALGATNDAPATLSASSAWAAHQAAFFVDGVNPTGSLTDPGSPLAGTVGLNASASDDDSFVASVLFQRSPANAGTWTDIGTADTASPYQASLDTTGVPDGLYDLRVVVTDGAGNVLDSTVVEDRRVDNTAPATTSTFPASTGTYGTAGWNTGCGTVGFCGTYSDAGSGVTQVQISIRHETGDYWSAGAFSSATEAWNTATIAGSNWSYAFAPGSFPADGSYTVRVRATDAAANVETPTSGSFTIDRAAPETTIDTGPADPTASTSADFAFSSSEGDSTFECRLDGSAWGACTSPASYTSLTDGSHTLEVRATDAADNTDPTAAAFTWLVDTAAPSSTVGFPGAGGEYNVSVWDGGCPTNGMCGTYADGSGAGVAQVQVSVRHDSTGLYWNGAAFASASEVLLGAALAGGDWALAFPASSFPADGDYTVSVLATDEVGNAETPSSRTFSFDATAPTGSLTAPADGAVLGGSVAVSSDSADGGSGVGQAEFQQRPAGGSGWTTIAADTDAPYSVDWDTTGLTDGDHDLRVITTDDAGNTHTSPTRTVTVDASAPSDPVVTLSESSPFAHVAGTEVFVNTDESGSYDVEATSSDGVSGIEKIRFPGPTDDSTSPYQASYGLGELSGGQTVTAFNGVGLTASSAFTVTPDTAEPSGGSVDYPNGYDADGDVTVTVDAGTDVLSGLAPGSAVLERRTAPLADGACDPFAGGWSAVSSPDPVASGLCAQYRYRVSDRVGNEAVFTSGHVVKVDLVTPAAPVLTLDESSPYAHAVGSEIFVNTAESGSYDVEADASDADSGVDKVAFPGGLDDTSAPYSATYDLDDLLGVETVTVHDRAGNTASSDFDVTEDVTAPSTTDDTASVGSTWQAAPVTVTLAPADAGSGVAATYFTTDGSVPTTSSDEGTSVDLTADGVYVIRYFSVDHVGNVEPIRTAFDTIRIDQADPDAPSVSLSESSPYAHADGNEIFVNTNQSDTYGVSATSSDSGSGVEKIVFPGGVEDSASPYSTTYGLGDLSGSQTVTAHDTAGNTASDTFTVTPDTDAPTGGSVTYPDGYDADGTVSVTADPGTDALSGIAAGAGVLERRTSALVDGACDPFAGGWSPVTSPDTVPDATCASYRFRVSDRVGNEAISTLPTSTVKVDLATPQTAIDAAPGDPSAETSPTFEFSANEVGSTFECRLDSGAWTGCSSPEAIGPLGDGSHTFEVRATDAGGNVDQTPASHTWTIDTAAPESSFGVVPADPSNDTTPSFEFSADEGGSTFECRLDGGAWTSCSSPETIGPLGDGSHTFEVRATDTAGNEDSTPEAYTWLVDAAPSLSIAQPSGFVNAADADPYTVLATSPDGDIASVELFRCSDASADCSGGTWVSLGTDAAAPYEASWPVDADGNRALRVVATDVAANTGSDVVNVTIDRTVPATTTASAPADPSASTDASFAFDSSEAGSTFECRLDAGAWEACSSPHGYTGLGEGSHTFHVRATDGAGNVDPTPATFDWTVDTVAPDTAVDNVPGDPSADASPDFGFSATEAGSSFECRLDAGAWEACSSPHGYTGLGEGSHTFRVRATDPAGNVDSSPAVYTWTIDATAPGGGLADPGQFLRGTVALSASPSDTGAGVQSVDFQVSPANAESWTSLDVDTTDPYGVDWDTTALADGVYDLRIVVTDNASNSSPSAVFEDRVVDNTAPTKPGGFKGTVSRGTFRLAWTAATDNSGLVSAYRILANGKVVKTVDGAARSAPMGRFKPTDTRAFQVAAVDAAGNVGPLSGKLKVVPKLTRLTLAAAKSTLKKRGFKVGKVIYKASASVPKGRVSRGVTGLRFAGSKIALTVSKG